MQARLLIFGKSCSLQKLHSLIRACTFINFWKNCTLHVYFILINSMVLDPAHLFPLLYPACLFEPACLFCAGFWSSLHIYLVRTFIPYTRVHILAGQTPYIFVSSTHGECPFLGPIQFHARCVQNEAKVCKTLTLI